MKILIKSVHNYICPLAGMQYERYCVMMTTEPIGLVPGGIDDRMVCVRLVE